MEKGQPMHNFEEMAVEVISFLQKWGMWQDTTIFTNGHKYTHVYEKEKKFKGISNVEFSEGTEPACIDFSNPEQIFDMVYEGPLYMLLSYDEYEVKKTDVREEAWDYIFEHTDILDDYIMEKFNVIDAKDLLDQIVTRKFENTDIFAWDPMIFDTWEEYLNFCGSEDRGNYVNSTRNDEDSEQLGNLERYQIIGVEDVMPLWEKMRYVAKKNFIEDCAYDLDEILYLPELADYIKSEFSNIFERYGLWYELGYEWSLTCYRK